MVVQHNMQAMNANRMLNVTTGQQAKSTEKLSSGYRINRAADDAAGLSISEKMRKQIRGLDRASTNAQDGVSAVQTAEGALGEVQDMLQRMNELAVQSANGTNSKTDRDAIQAEIDQLSTEIDRVSETTKFNETYLLKGDRNATRKVSYSFNNNFETVAAKANMYSDEATGINADGKTKGTGVEFNANAKQDDQNAIAKALRDQGISVTYRSTYADPTDGTGASGGEGTISNGYTLTLNGDAAQKYDVVTVFSYNQDENGKTINDEYAANTAQFKIQDKNGNDIATITVGGAEMEDATKTEKDKTSSSILTAESVTAAKNTNEISQYFDKDGNKISANSLSKYYSLTKGGVNQANGMQGGGVTTTEDLEVSGTPAATENATLTLQSDGTWSDGVNNNVDLSAYGISDIDTSDMASATIEFTAAVEKDPEINYAEHTHSADQPIYLIDNDTYSGEDVTLTYAQKVTDTTGAKTNNITSGALDISKANATSGYTLTFNAGSVSVTTANAGITVDQSSVAASTKGANVTTATSVVYVAAGGYVKGADGKLVASATASFTTDATADTVKALAGKTITKATDGKWYDEVEEVTSNGTTTIVGKGHEVSTSVFTVSASTTAGSSITFETGKWYSVETSEITGKTAAQVATIVAGAYSEDGTTIARSDGKGTEISADDLEKDWGITLDDDKFKETTTSVSIGTSNWELKSGSTTVAKTTGLSSISAESTDDIYTSNVATAMAKMTSLGVSVNDALTLKDGKMSVEFGDAGWYDATDTAFKSEISDAKLKSTYGIEVVEGFNPQHGDSISLFEKTPATATLTSTDKADPSDDISVRADSPRVYDGVGNETTLDVRSVAAKRDVTGDLTVKLHVGADATSNNQISVNIANMSAKALGVNGMKVDGEDDTNAKEAIETIKQALQKVSDQRSALGAAQNRLEHTINNLDNVVENTTAAESRIRDTDIADEMVTYSKNNILAQAGQSMLAQANQSTQGALSLLG